MIKLDLPFFCKGKKKERGKIKQTSKQTSNNQKKKKTQSKLSSPKTPKLCQVTLISSHMVLTGISFY